MKARGREKREESRLHESFLDSMKDVTIKMSACYRVFKKERLQHFSLSKSVDADLSLYESRG